MGYLLIALGFALVLTCNGTTRTPVTGSTSERPGDPGDWDKCGLAALDQTTADLVFFGSGPLAPDSEEELNAECVRLRSSLQATERYAKNCTTGLGQVMIKMFAEAAGKELHYHCDGKGKVEYLKLMPCLVEKAGTFLYKCNNRYSGHLQAVVEQDKADRIPLSCCYQAVFERCIKKAAKKCGEDHAKFAAKVVATMSEELKDTACRKWVRDPTQCKTLPKITPVKNPKYHTMLPTLVAILDSI